MTGDQLAVGDCVNSPVLHLGKGGTEAHQFVLDKEGHHLCQPYSFFFAIGEAGHGLAIDQELAGWRLEMTERTRRVADHREDLAGSEERFQQLDRVILA